MADLKENQIAEITNPIYLRSLDASGNSGKTSMGTLFNQSLSVRDWINQDSGSIDDLGTGLYALSNATGAKYKWGMLISVNFLGGFKMQINISSSDNSCAIRSKWNTAWSDWRNL